MQEEYDQAELELECQEIPSTDSTEDTETKTTIPVKVELDVDVDTIEEEDEWARSDSEEASEEIVAESVTDKSIEFEEEQSEPEDSQESQESIIENLSQAAPVKVAFAEPDEPKTVGFSEAPTVVAFAEPSYWTTGTVKCPIFGPCARPRPQDFRDSAPAPAGNVAGFPTLFSMTYFRDGKIFWFTSGEIKNYRKTDKSDPYHDKAAEWNLLFQAFLFYDLSNHTKYGRSSFKDFLSWFADRCQNA